MKKSNVDIRQTREKFDEAVQKVKKIGDDLKNAVKRTKEKFENADSQTKKKIVLGIAGAVAALTALIGAKKIKDKIKKNKEK